MKKFIIFLILLSLFFVGCSKSDDDKSLKSQIYVYRVYKEQYALGKDLFVPQALDYQDGDSLLMGLCYKIMSMPKEENLKSVLPSNVSILNATKDGNTATVFLSADYEGLSEAEKMLANYGIALSLCTIEGIDYVSLFMGDVTVAKEISPKDMIVSNSSISSTSSKIPLYYPDEDFDYLYCEYASLDFSENSPTERNILEKLFDGPYSKELLSIFPENAVVLSTYTQNNLCTISLSKEFLELENSNIPKAELAIYSIVNTLCSAKNISSVQFLIEGTYANKIAELDIRKPLEFNKSIISSSLSLN